MKTTPFALFSAAVLFLIISPANAQVVSPLKPITPVPQAKVPPAPMAAPAAMAAEVPDGIVFYDNVPYLIRHGRATVINAELVPKGQILTFDGKFVTIPSSYTQFSGVNVPKGTSQQVRSVVGDTTTHSQHDPTHKNGGSTGGTGLNRN